MRLKLLNCSKYAILFNLAIISSGFSTETHKIFDDKEKINHILQKFQEIFEPAKFMWNNPDSISDMYIASLATNHTEFAQELMIENPSVSDNGKSFLYTALRWENPILFQNIYKNIALLFNGNHSEGDQFLINHLSDSSESSTIIFYLKQSYKHLSSDDALLIIKNARKNGLKEVVKYLFELNHFQGFSLYSEYFIFSYMYKMTDFFNQLCQQEININELTYEGTQSLLASIFEENRVDLLDHLILSKYPSLHIEREDIKSLLDRTKESDLRLTKLLCTLKPEFVFFNSSNYSPLFYLIRRNKKINEELCLYLINHFKKHPYLLEDQRFEKILNQITNLNFIQELFSVLGNQVKEGNNTIFFKFLHNFLMTKQIGVISFLIQQSLTIKDFYQKSYYQFIDHYNENKKDVAKYRHSIYTLITHPTFDITEEERAEYQKYINDSRNSFKANTFPYSNHKKLIHWNNEGNLGKGVDLVIVDFFAQNLQDNEQILLHKRLNEKISQPFRDFCSAMKINVNTVPSEHGIHVAGIIVDDEMGIAPNAKIIPIQLSYLREKFVESILHLYDPSIDINSQNLGGIEMFSDYISTTILSACPKPTVINLSLEFGSLFTPQQQEIFESRMFKQLCQNNIVVKAAGNNGNSIPDFYRTLVQEDESIRNHLFVVSNGTRDKISFCSYPRPLNPSSCYFGDGNTEEDPLWQIGLCAPGTYILSTIPETGIEQFAFETGTSMAAPMVTAAIAKLMSDYPTLTLSEIAQIIRQSANKEAPYSEQKYFGQGHLDLRKAYEVAQIKMDQKR